MTTAYLGPETLTLLERYREATLNMIGNEGFDIDFVVNYFEDIFVIDRLRIEEATERQAWHDDLLRAMDVFLPEIKMHRLLGTLPQPPEKYDD